MSGFKLLAIRTGKLNHEKIENGEAKNFFKVLKEDTLYKFYNEYEFLDKEGENIEVDSYEPTHSIRYTPTVPENLYQLRWEKEGYLEEKKIDINISAIVGKNGSGKSTLLELLFAATYLLWESKKKNDKDVIAREKNTLEKEKKEFDELIAPAEEYLLKLKDLVEKRLGKEYRTSVYTLDRLKDRLVYFDKKAKEHGSLNYAETIEAIFKQNNSILENSIDLEVYYEINRVFYRLKLSSTNGSEFKLLVNKSDKTNKVAERDFQTDNLLKKKKALSEYFFYTVAISYSQYGLNSKLEGDWLQQTFHKNDSYQMPLVVNPMRTGGQIDFNREDELVRQRMLANLLEPVENVDQANLRNLTKNKKASKLKIVFNNKKYDRYKEKYELVSFKKNETFVQDLYEKYTNSEKKLIEHKASDECFWGNYYYIFSKLERIGKTYDRYSILKDPVKGDTKSLIEELIKDRSHITYKLKQALNYLKYKEIESFDAAEHDIETLSKELNKILESDKERNTKVYNKESNEINRINQERSIIEYLPPPIFDTKIILQDNSDFELMSSGEKQKVHVINSIVYHLINLNSVSDNGIKTSSKNDDTNKKQIEEFNQYNYINVLFDEVEQYFHPDLQRTFIADLRDTIGRMNRNNVEHIKGINFLFATHSPFILSDIPMQNTIRLKTKGVGTKQKSLSQPIEGESFGGNVHDLLADGFFMEDGFMGEFAKSEIEECIQFLNLEKIFKKYKKEKENKGDLLIEYNKILSRRGDLENKEKIDKNEGRKYFRSNKYYLSLIHLIGEPILKAKLLDMYNDVFDLKKRSEKQTDFIKLAKELNIDVEAAKKLLR